MFFLKVSVVAVVGSNKYGRFINYNDRCFSRLWSSWRFILQRKFFRCKSSAVLRVSRSRRTHWQYRRHGILNWRVFNCLVKRQQQIIRRRIGYIILYHIYYHCNLFKTACSIIKVDSNRCVHTYPDSVFSSSSKCKFNRQGTRLLGREINDPFVAVADVPTFTGSAATAATSYRTCSSFGTRIFRPWMWIGELVVSASTDHNLYVWSFPGSQGSDISYNQSLLELCGHTGSVYAIQIDPCNDVLASGAGREKVIKLWTPILLSDSLFFGSIISFDWWSYSFRIASIDANVWINLE